jgi:16S rRNA (guanine527-N7)-methyltransferase
VADGRAAGDSAAVAAPPAGAAEVFGPALPAIVRYAELLCGPGVERGIVGPAEAERIWDRHLLNCAAVARLVPPRSVVADVGSGAGLPGIVLALLLPEANVTLIEPLARRTAFLEECVADLSLSNASVVRGRAEDLAGDISADVVTARAVAPLDRLAPLCAGLARPGGRVLAIKGASAEAELARARPVLTRLGVSDARVVEVSSADGAAAATVVMFSTAAASHADGQRRRHESGTSGRPAGRAGVQRGYVQPGGGRRARPNSRRGGG